MSQEFQDLVTKFESRKDTQVTLKISLLPDLPSVVICEAFGELNTTNSGFFQDRMDLVFKDGYNTIIFNLSGVSYVSSTGIGAFTSLLRASNQLGGKVVISNIRPRVLEVFQLLGFDQFFKITTTVQEAVKHLYPNPKELQVPSGSTPNFPKLFRCPVCDRKLRAAKAGRYRCSSCQSGIALLPNGRVTLIRI